ncbi:MAG: PP2C family protein-serine/threonine phosphatase [Synechococcus sp.]|nr:PP2C family protein-serine/threonine phosphatase [Synechococcus sp.]
MAALICYATGVYHYSLDTLEQYFTMWYGVYDIEDRILTYGCAGHPPAVLVKSGANEPPQLLKSRGFPVGILPPDLSAYEENSIYLPFGSQLYLFSDGAYENPQSQKPREQWQRFLNYLQQFQGNSLQPLIQTLGDRLHSNHFDDDFSLLRVTL